MHLVRRITETAFRIHRERNVSAKASCSNGHLETIANTEYRFHKAFIELFRKSNSQGQRNNGACTEMIPKGEAPRQTEKVRAIKPGNTPENLGKKEKARARTHSLESADRLFVAVCARRVASRAHSPSVSCQPLCKRVGPGPDDVVSQQVEGVEHKSLFIANSPDNLWVKMIRRKYSANP